MKYKHIFGIYLLVLIFFQVLFISNLFSEMPSVNYKIGKKTNPQDFSKKTYTYKKVNNHEILADVYSPEKKKIRPVVIYIHGGFMFGNRLGLREPLRDKLIEADYVVVSIDFRLAPETKLEKMIEDVRDACTWVREKGPELFNINPEKLAVAGGSAGAYLSLVSGYTLIPQPQVLTVISGIGDFDEYIQNMNPDKSGLRKNEGPYRVVGDKPISDGGYEDRLDLWRYLDKNGWYLSELLGFDPKTEPKRYDDLVLFKNIPSDFPPTLIIHAKKDDLVPFSTAEKIRMALTDKGVENELFIVPEGHSSQVIRGYPEAVEKIVSFLDKYLK